MEQQKRKWHTIGLPSDIFVRIRELIKLTGHTSISEYVRDAVLEKERVDRNSDYVEEALALKRKYEGGEEDAERED